MFRVMRKNLRLQAFKVFLLVFVGGCCGSDFLASQNALARELLKNYAVGSPPAIDGKPVVVEVQFALGQLSDVSTVQERLEMKGWWRLRWTDVRLRWNESWGVSYLTFGADQIWVPDVVVYEHVLHNEMFQAGVTIYPDGSASISKPQTNSIACPMRLSAFPFDHQRCNFTFGSWSFDGSIVDVVPRRVDPSTFYEPSSEPVPEWAVTDVSIYREFAEWSLAAVRVVWRNNHYFCCNAPYPVLIFEIEIYRATQTHFSGSIGPLIVVIIIGFFSLLMPAPISGARPALSVTILLTTTTVFFVASSTTPQSNESTVVGRLYNAAMVMSFILVILSILTTALNSIKSPDPVNKDRLLDIFRQHDVDGSGSLNTVQAIDALASMRMGQKEQVQVMKFLDKDRDGLISEKEWLAIGDLLSKADARATYHNSMIEWLVRLGTNKSMPNRATAAACNRVNSFGASGRQFQAMSPSTPKPTSSSPGTPKPTSPSRSTLRPLSSSGSTKAHDPAHGSPHAPEAHLSLDCRIDPRSSSGSEALTVKGGPQPNRNNIEPEAAGINGPAAAGEIEISGQPMLMPDGGSSIQPAGVELRAANSPLPHSASLLPPPSITSNGLAEHLAGVVVNPHLEAPQKGRELAARIDAWALLVLPLGFVIYLILELAGAWSGHTLSLSGGKRGYVSDHSGNRKILLELVDERSGEASGGITCYRNFPIDQDSKDVRATMDSCPAR